MKKEKKKNLKLLSPRQKKFVKKVLETGNFTKSALEAGYATREYGVVLKNKEEIREALLEALAKQGVSNELIAKRIREGLDALTPKRFSAKGTLIQEEVPDHFARNLYLDKILKISGAILQPEKVELNQSKNITIILNSEMVKALLDTEAIDAEVIKDLPAISNKENQINEGEVNGK